MVKMNQEVSQTLRLARKNNN